MATFHELIEQARSRLAEADGLLDNTATRCDGCGHLRYADFEEHLLHEQLSGMTVKLSNILERRTRINAEHRGPGDGDAGVA